MGSRLIKAIRATHEPGRRYQWYHFVREAATECCAGTVAATVAHESADHRARTSLDEVAGPYGPPMARGSERIYVQSALRQRSLRPRRMSLQIAALRLLAFVVFLLLWWAASVFSGSSLIPTPLATAQAAGKLFAQERIYRATLESLSIYAAGYATAAIIAIPLGLVMGGFRILGRTLDVYVNALSATPRVAFIPLIIGLLGLGFNAKVSVVFLGAVVPILLNTYVGVLNADGELVEMVRSTGAKRWQIFGRILLPGAMPFIMVGLRLGATIGLINTVVAELYTAINGLGGLLAIYGNTFQMAPYFVVVFILSLIGVTVTQFISLVEARMDKWRYRDS